MRVGFAGTPAFAARALEAIHRRGHTVALVLTQPDRPFGRGLATRASDVKAYAVAHGLPLAQPPSLRTEDALAVVREAALDVLVVAAYGLILPKAVLELPACGCLNIHASLLPRWRGAAPIARAIEAGDRETGITIMRMDAGLDTGPIVTASAIPIEPRETAGSLHDKLAALGAELIVRTLDGLVREGALASMPQPAGSATYAAKIETRDTLLDWSADAEALDRRIRALSPSPGAIVAWHDKPLKIRAAHPAGGDRGPAPGTIVAATPEGIDVACGHGVMRVTEVQPAGGRAMSAHAFALGHRVRVGDAFGNGR
jgi:methionyl-tRNA formyltransferase